MLLKNKLSIFVILTILISSIVSAALLCPVEEVRTSLKKSLYEFLTNPSASTLSLEQIKDLLIFYLGIQPGAIRVNCSQIGSNSNLTISAIINQAKEISDITTCSDGTQYGECSSLKPEYCYAGTLINQCETCGCPDGELCNISTSECISIPGVTIECNVNSNCGTNNYISGYFCSNDNVYRNYSTFTCNNSNTADSYCTNETTTILIETCPYGCTNGVCMEPGLGPELVSCWHFYCGSDYGGWIVGDNWEVGEERDGIAKFYEVGEDWGILQQNINVEPGKKYRIQIGIYDFITDCSPRLIIFVGGTDVGAISKYGGMATGGIYTYENGRHTYQNITASTTENLRLIAECEDCEPGDITEIYLHTASVREEILE